MHVIAQGIVLLFLLIILIVCLIRRIITLFIEEWEHMDDDEDMYIRRK